MKYFEIDVRNDKPKWILFISSVPSNLVNDNTFIFSSFKIYSSLGRGVTFYFVHNIYLFIIF